MPYLGRVMGTIWGTARYPGLEDAKMQLLQPISADGKPTGTPIAVVDTVGAGPGELVFYVTAYEAVIPFHRPMVPIDASIVGIVDQLELVADSVPAASARTPASDAPKGAHGGAPLPMDKTGKNKRKSNRGKRS